jgi:hypothetical protein
MFTLMLQHSMWHWYTPEMGFEIFLLKSANHKSANSWAYSAIANPQIFMIYPQLTNLQIPTKYCTSLSQNSLKSRLFKKYNFLINNYVLWYRAFFALFGRRKMYVICGLADILSPQLTTKNGSANRKSAKCNICGRSANLANYLKVHKHEIFLILFLQKPKPYGPKGL